MVLFAKFVPKEKVKVIYLVDLTKTDGTLMTYIKTVTNFFFFFLSQALGNFYKFLNASLMELLLIFIVNYFIFMLYVFLG